MEKVEQVEGAVGLEAGRSRGVAGPSGEGEGV